MISKFTYKFFLILATISLNCFGMNSEQIFNACHNPVLAKKIISIMNDKEIENLIKYIENNIDRTDEKNDTIIKNICEATQNETWRDIGLECWNSFLLGAKIGMILFIPCYLIEKYFGYRLRFIVY